MTGKIFFILTAVSVVFAVVNGSPAELANAVLDGASRAVELTVSLAGMMCLWNAVMNIALKSGAVSALSKVMRPVLSLAFPSSFKSGHGSEEITAAVCANLLGIGNAATPLALRAMSELDRARTGDDATDDEVTFAALGAASIDLLPVTVIAMRRAAGSDAPFDIVVPVFICSTVCAVMTVTLARLLSLCRR